MSILTVVTPSATSDLTTVAIVKQRFKITSGADDANLAAWISDASEAIASELNRVLGEEALQEEFHSHPEAYGHDGHDHFRSVFGESGYQTLVLSRRPVSTISSILDEGGNVIDPSLYGVTADAGILRIANNRAISFPYDPLWPHGKITVLYTAGYPLPAAAPRPLSRACIRMVSHYRSSETRDPAAKSVAVQGIGSREYWVGAVGDNGALPPEVLDLISKFRDVAA